MSPDEKTGLLTGTALGAIQSGISYNSYGEVDDELYFDGSGDIIAFTGGVP